jgi:hypothetical protein
VSMTIYGNIGASAFKVRRGVVVVWRPKGRLRCVGRRATKGQFAVEGVKQLQARLFVGLNVGGKPRWSLADVVRLVLRARHAQGRSAGATFLAQKGVYQVNPKAPIDRENSVQIILMNLYDGLPERTFLTDVRKLAKCLTRGLKQEQIIVEVSRGGRVVQTYVEVLPTSLRA